jgi:phosphoribosyl 1,2-cyclic phosphodiesterase
MKLIFHGTKGNIDASTEFHRRHTVLTVEYRGMDVTVDCGAEWKDHLDELDPHAIVLTHAHPDHARGLEDGSPCPVYATRTTLDRIADFPIDEKHTLKEETETEIRGIRFTPFPVEHSLRAPAVGYRISAGKAAVFYAPDLVYIKDREKALSGVKVYIGDGATMVRSMVRKKGDRLFGHTPVRTQLTWCRKFEIPQAVITHCGSGIVKKDRDENLKKLAELAEERGVEATIAYDGMEMVIR